MLKWYPVPTQAEHFRSGLHTLLDSCVLFSQALLEFFLCWIVPLHLVIVGGLSALHANVLWLQRRSELVSCDLAWGQKQCGWAWAALAVWAGAIPGVDLCALELSSLVFLMCSCTLVDVTCVTVVFTFARLYLKEKALSVKKKIITFDNSHLLPVQAFCPLHPYFVMWIEL